MSVGVVVEDSVTIPPGIDSLEAFRAWALSPDFPDRGRIDYIRGMIEVDMMPERMSSHGEVKVEIGRVLANLVREKELGKVLMDSTRVSSPVANFSCEPDVMVLLHETIGRGEVSFVPSADATDSVEIQGGPDLVVEIVSPSSVAKDTRRLPPAYFEAGVREFWLIDARDDELLFQIFHRGTSGFVEMDVDNDGFQTSDVLDRRYRLLRERDRRGEWRFVLEERGRVNCEG